MSRTTRGDVIAAAGRLFAERGYHGTSMRELGRELGLLGSSLYSHVGSKQDLLVEVVRRGGQLFAASADAARNAGGSARDRLRALIGGHLDIVLDHRDEVRTFLNEARSLDEAHRRQILAARDQYEQVFRATLKEGQADGSLRDDLDPALTTIFILSILNAVERWFNDTGRLSRTELADRILDFANV